jgi:hypothetical protein
MPELDRDKVAKDFHEVVNMTAAEIGRWLKTAQSRSVGFKGADGQAKESVGHASGRKIVAILAKGTSELSDADYQHMRKVVGYVKRHSAQPPANQVTSRWHYSLMNWGHDPLKS